FFQAEDGIRDRNVTGVQTCALPIFADAMGDDVFLVSVMTAGNETGSVQPVRELAAIAHSHGALFHTDAVQAAGALPLNVRELGRSEERRVGKECKTGC